MKEVFLPKQIIKKIIIAIVFVCMFNFTFGCLGCNIVFASDTKKPLTDNEMDGIGGLFLVPITEFIIFLADSVLQLLQNSFLSSAPVTIKASSDENKDISGWFWAALGIVAIVAGVITCGVGIAAVASAGAAATGFMATTLSVASATLGVSRQNNNRWNSSCWWSMGH